MAERIFKDLSTTIKDLDQKGRVVVAANCLGNVDSQKQVSMQGSFVKTLKDNFSRLRWFLNHDTRLLLGVSIEGKEVFPYLQMEGQLNMNKELSRDIYEDYKLYAEYGKSLEHSIGVEPIKENVDADGISRVYEWKMWEWSTLTHWGANENTPLLGIKSAEDYAGAVDWLELKLRKGNFTDNKYLQIEQQLLKLKTLIAEPEHTSTQNSDEPILMDLKDVFKTFSQTHLKRQTCQKQQTLLLLQ